MTLTHLSCLTVGADPTREELASANAAVQGSGFVFPADSNILNVKAFGALGDGVQDDTAAIQSAYNRTGLIYFPNGTYMISAPIKAPPRQGGAASRRIVQGQSRDGVVIRLKDNSAEFSDPAKPQPLILVSWGVAQAFRNAVRSVTIDTGAGNPGAVGLEFFASNQGIVEDVAIRSGGANLEGHVGLQLKGDNGPLMVRGLFIRGFTTGIDANANAVAVFKDVRIEGQTGVGIDVRNKSFFQGVESSNLVTALRISSPTTVVLNAQLKSGAPDNPAIAYNAGTAFLRDIVTTGYGKALGGKGELAGPAIQEWTSGPPISLVGDLKQSLRLPMKDIPAVAWANPRSWKNAAKDGLTVTLESLQTALNSGASTIYFPAGSSSTLTGAVTVPETVERIIGCEAGLRAPDKKKGVTFSIQRGTRPLLIERFDTIYGMVELQIRSARPVIVRSMNIENIDLQQGSTGELFLEDVVSGTIDIRGQKVWAWQFDQEKSFKPETNAATDTSLNPLAGLPRAGIRNEGGELWILGMKTEQNCTKVWTTRNGKSEIYAYLMANYSKNPYPMFIAEDSATSIFVYESVRRNAPYVSAFKGVYGGKLFELSHQDAPKRGQEKTIPLLTAVPSRSLSSR